MCTVFARWLCARVQKSVLTDLWYSGGKVQSCMNAVMFLLCPAFMLTWLNCVYPSSQRSPSPGPNHVTPSINTAPSSASAPPTTSAARTSCSLTPSLSSHFSENLIRHVQGWPAEHVEKQVGPTPIFVLVFVLMAPSDLCNVQNNPGIKTTWGGSHYGEHLFVWELHRAQKSAFFGQSVWNPSNAARAEVRICKHTCKGKHVLKQALLLPPPQDTVPETANQRTGKVEESEFFHGLRTNGWQLQRFRGEEGGALCT